MIVAPAGGRQRERRRGRASALPLAAFVLAVMVPLAGLLVSSWVLGWNLQPVYSGSMDPTYPVGSLLVVEPIDASEVRPGMAVTYADPAQPHRLVTHRVLRSVPGENLAFMTQGDANVTPDPQPVPARFVRGKVRWHLPGVGAAVRWLEWPRGFLILVVAPALVLLVTEAQAWRRRRVRKQVGSTGGLRRQGAGRW